MKYILHTTALAYVNTALDFIKKNGHRTATHKLERDFVCVCLKLSRVLGSVVQLQQYCEMTLDVQSDVKLCLLTEHLW